MTSPVVIVAARSRASPTRSTVSTAATAAANTTRSDGRRFVKCCRQPNRRDRSSSRGPSNPSGSTRSVKCQHDRRRRRSAVRRWVTVRCEMIPSWDDPRRIDFYRSVTCSRFRSAYWRGRRVANRHPIGVFNNVGQWPEREAACLSGRNLLLFSHIYVKKLSF